MANLNAHLNKTLLDMMLGDLVVFTHANQAIIGTVVRFTNLSGQTIGGPSIAGAVTISYENEHGDVMTASVELTKVGLIGDQIVRWIAKNVNREAGR